MTRAEQTVSEVTGEKRITATRREFVHRVDRLELGSESGGHNCDVETHEIQVNQSLLAY